MPHDRIKTEARERMAETGEPYSVARRAVIQAHQQEQRLARLTAQAAAADRGDLSGPEPLRWADRSDPLPPKRRGR